MTLDVSRLKECLSILSLAISKNSSDRPSTKMIELSTENGFLYGYTDNGINNIRMKICDTTDSINATCEFSLFYDIIKNCDSSVDIKTTNKAISIKSNDLKCKIPIHSSASGKSGIKHPSTVSDNDIDFSEIKDILPICKSIIDTDLPIICYRKIYFSNKIMVSDTDNVAIIDKNIFNEPVLLELSSVEILSKLSNCKYKIESNQKDVNEIQKVLHISSDDIDITIISILTEEYQYNDLINLFSINIANKTTIDVSSLSKAVSVSKLFKHTPNLVFDENGTSLQIISKDFVYNINKDNLERHMYITSNKLINNILATKSDKLDVYFNSNGLLKCVNDEVEMILSIEEV